MELKTTIQEHYQLTGSVLAKSLLDNFDKERENFVKVLQRDYARVMKIQQDAIISGYEPDGDEVWTQILEVTNG